MVLNVGSDTGTQTEVFCCPLSHSKQMTGQYLASVHGHFNILIH